MIRNLLRVAFAALLLAFATGCGKKAEPGTTPDGAIRTSAELVQKGDFAGLLQHIMPPAEFARFKAEWAADAKNKPITDEDRQKFAETMAKLTAPDAETAIYAEIEPKLAQYDTQLQQQMPMYVGIGRSWLSGMVNQNKDLSDADKKQALAAIGAIGDWAQKTHFTDPALVKQVLAIACKTARDVNLKTLDEARALDFDQSMRKLGTVFLGVKQILAVYGFSLDDTLASVNPVVTSSDATSAKVKVSYTLLGTPLSSEADMVQVDHHWYGKDLIDKLARDAASRKDAAAAPAAVPATPAAAPTPPATAAQPAGH
jgi:hypothetical protein